ARLLRFLNDRRYERLGEAHERQANVRLLAATNRVLEDEVRAGRFREDLFYRLNVITLTLPALRDRVEDIPLLAQHYLAMFGRKQGRSALAFSTDANETMLIHGWPGNLRELRNSVERAVILATGPLLTTTDLGLRMETRSDGERQSEQSARLGAPISLAALEREHIARIIAQSPSLEAAARTLDIDATTLQR